MLDLKSSNGGSIPSFLGNGVGLEVLLWLGVVRGACSKDKVAE